jgi:hypothetical protein
VNTTTILDIPEPSNPRLLTLQVHSPERLGQIPPLGDTYTFSLFMVARLARHAMGVYWMGWSVAVGPDIGLVGLLGECRPCLEMIKTHWIHSLFDPSRRCR